MKTLFYPFLALAPFFSELLSEFFYFPEEETEGVEKYQFFYVAAGGAGFTNDSTGPFMNFAVGLRTSEGSSMIDYNVGIYPITFSGEALLMPYFQANYLYFPAILHGMYGGVGSQGIVVGTGGVFPEVPITLGYQTKGKHPSFIQFQHLPLSSFLFSLFNANSPQIYLSATAGYGF